MTSLMSLFPVIPAKAGIQAILNLIKTNLDAGIRRMTNFYFGSKRQLPINEFGTQWLGAKDVQFNLVRTNR